MYYVHSPKGLLGTPAII